MKAVKFLGLCTLFLLAIVSVHANQVNETMLSQLLDSYGSDYDDGSFSVVFDKAGALYSFFDGPIGGAGNNTFKFNISGSGTYTATATLSLPLETSPGKWIEYGNVIETKTTSANNVKFEFDGNYFSCDNTVLPGQNFYIDLKIYQNSLLNYQKRFEKSYLCLTKSIIFDYTQSKRIKGLEKGIPDGKYEELEMNLTFYFPENKTIKVGASIEDNKTSSAYTEKTIAILSPPIDCGGYWCFLETISFKYNTSELKSFELNNEKILLKSIVVNDHSIDYPWVIFYYNNITQTTTFNSGSSFNYQSIYINSYPFTESVSNGKIKTLDVALNDNGYPGPYDLELSLENQYGEVVLTNKTKGVAFPATISFNGTEIYQSKVNGPYRLGFIRITDSSGNELFYKTNKGLSKELTYMNFTNPNMPDLEINGSDLKSDGTDLNVTIHNRGKGDAVGITVSVFKSDATKIKEVILSNVSANVDYRYIITGVSEASFVFIDFTNSVEESNESNNVAELVPPNLPPILASIGSQFVNESSLLQFTINAADPENDILTYSTTTLPSGALFNPGTRIFSWTPNFLQAGIHYVMFKVMDNNTNSDQENVTITVTDNNQIPSITTTPGTSVIRGSSYSYDMNATDLDGDTLMYWTNATFGSINSLTGLYTWTPDPNLDYETRTITFSVTDGKSAPVTQQAAISPLEDIYTLKASTLDFNQRESNNHVYINSDITINSIGTLSSVGNTTPASFNVPSNTAYDITHSSAGYQSDTDRIYFDSKLSSMTNGLPITLTTAGYVTSCIWEASKSNWYCSVEGNGMKKTWFRYERLPAQTIRRVNYLLR